MSTIKASEFDGDLVTISNQYAAEILKRIQKNMLKHSARGNGKILTMLEINLALLKAIELLEKTPD